MLSLAIFIKCDTIEFNGKFWLVPEWIDNISAKTSKPKRIICLDSLPHQKEPSGSPADFVLNYPIPKSVFDGEIPRETTFQFEIVEEPDISFDIQNEQPPIQ